jgi:hypothetical protein
MSYKSYEIESLFLKDCDNICTICEICDSAKVRGFIRWKGNAVENAQNYFTIKELLEIKYGLTLHVQCYVDKDDVVKCVADKVMHYANCGRFVVSVVMN